MKRRTWSLVGAASAVSALLAMQCASPSSDSKGSASSAAVSAWNVVYGVLEHPRCMNCHPAGAAPLQGDDGHAHAQNVQRGADGKGLYAMRCDACHQTENLAGAHLPPGAPKWHLPRADMPLVFEGKSSSELCRQLKDARRNGGLTPEQLYAHVDRDPLVLWGWSPGEGRTPVSTSHADFVKAMRTWIDNGCGCP
jgi:cytochrome c5